MASQITQIPNKPIHDTIISEAETTPTIIYVSNSALPICKDFTPKYEALAKQYNESSASNKENEAKPSIRFCQLEITSETSAMFKFSPNQLPVIVLVCRGPWSKTLMSPKVPELERGIEEMMERAATLRN